jgi:hypothetical protein
MGVEEKRVPLKTPELGPNVLEKQHVWFIKGSF